MSQLRKPLGEDEAHPYIETIPKRGYRFVAEVRRVTILVSIGPISAEAVPVAAEPPLTGRSARGTRLGTLLAIAAAAIIGVALGVTRFSSVFQHPSQFEELPFTALQGGEYEPAFSADGKTIAFVWTGATEKHYGIYTKPVNGGEVTQVVSDSYDEGSPVWSPDGRSIAFVRDSTGNTTGVYIIRLQDRFERKVETLFPVVNIYDRKLD